MIDDITELFCFVDDFVQKLEKEFLEYNLRHNIKIRKPTRVPGITKSELLTILIIYHNSGFKNFKSFYTFFKALYIDKFPNLPTYERIIALKPRVRSIMEALLKDMASQNCQKAKIAFIDSTSIKVCNNKRIFNHKVFKDYAMKGKSTMGYFYGFKLHAMIDTEGNLLDMVFSQGNVDDRTHVKWLVKNFKGKLFADKGYISKSLFTDLYENGVKLITGIKSNMKNKLMDLREKIMLRKRSIIESTFSVMKESLGLVHTKHRSFQNAYIHWLGVVLSYQLRKNKPSIKESYSILNENDFDILCPA